jgi:hypothetical protein
VKPALHAALATAVFTRPRARNLQWCAALHAQHGERVLAPFISCVTQSGSDFTAEAAKLGVGLSGEPAVNSVSKAQLLALRGLLAGDLLLHCLTLRHRVQYGINDKQCAPATTLRAC